MILPKIEHNSVPVLQNLAPSILVQAVFRELVGAGSSVAVFSNWRGKKLELPQLLKLSKDLHLNLKEEFLTKMLLQAAATGGGQGTEPAITLADFERVMACTCLY